MWSWRPPQHRARQKDPNVRPDPAIPVTTDRVRDLVAHLESDARSASCILVSRRWGGAQGADADRIRQMNTDVEVYTLDGDDAAEELRAVSHTYATTGGAVRVVGSRAGAGTVIKMIPAHERPTEGFYEDLRDTVRALQEPGRSELVYTSSSNQPGTLRAPTPLDVATERRVRTHETVTGDTPPVSAPAEQAPTATGTLPAAVEVLHAVNALAAQHDDMRATLDALTTAVHAIARHLTDLEEHLTTPRTDESGDVDEALFKDPERQLRHDINLDWLRHLPEDDRNDHPLRPYTLGPEFIDSTQPARFTLATRHEIVRACVDVLTSRVYTLPVRRAHPMRTSAGGSATNLIREDGARAHRANIASRTGGPRIMWWEHTDGSVEFAKVAPHDDYTLR